MNVLMSGGRSGIGKAMRTTLVDMGYSVYNISRSEGEILCDLSDTKTLEREVKQWLQTHELHVLLNCAGVGVFQPHETLSSATIQNILHVNLLAPILLTNLCLKSLKATKGHIFNVSSIEATRHAKYSALYTATKSGLRDFGLSLFEEVRKDEVKVTSLNPDMTKTPFFDTLHFAPSSKENEYLVPQTLANTMRFILENEAVITDITIRSPKFGIQKKQGK
ncbi:MAG: SDR family oxidoreductase [Sulfurospirillum sp.]|nr:SDR family oxidoreductase [Sulfurospirillum sp.]